MSSSPVTRRQTRAMSRASGDVIFVSSDVEPSPRRTQRKRRAEQVMDSIEVDTSPDSKRSKPLPVRRKEFEDMGPEREKPEVIVIDLVEDDPEPPVATAESAEDVDGPKDAEEPLSVEDVPEAEGSEKVEEAPPQQAESPVVTTRKIVFDDEGNDPAAPAAALSASAKSATDAVPEPGEAEEEEEEADDDDDAAPEAVSTHRVETQTDKSAKAAVKAAEELQASRKRKRDVLFKEQAQVRKQKKKKLAAAEEGDGGGKKAKKAKRPPAPADDALPRDKHGRLVVPDTLPAALLESLESSDSDSDSDSGRRAPPHHAGGRRQRQQRGGGRVVKFGEDGFATALTEEERRRRRKKQRERVVGGAVYRVAKPLADARLPPKAAGNAAAMRKDLLIRGRKLVGGAGGGRGRRR